MFTPENEMAERIPEKSLEDYKRELRNKNAGMNEVINKVEAVITDKEKQRNFKINSKFFKLKFFKGDWEKEKNFILQMQSKVKEEIDNISKNNLNERIINYIKQEVIKVYSLYLRKIYNKTYITNTTR